MQFVLHGFGVFLGVLAGVMVTLIVQSVNGRRYRKQRQSNLKFEFKLNVKKIDAWLKELETLRDAINGDSLHTYYGYIDLSKSVVTTTDDMFQVGELYNNLTHEEIEGLQGIIAGLSYKSENYVNGRISQNRLAYSKAREEDDNRAMLTSKQNAAEDVKGWRDGLEGYKKSLLSLTDKL